ncbi:MAG: threonine--tRNA ligase [Clostridia bacterium]|jgi:threonyl-tRNA synthetase|nr:threonine--tRNA ligase [Clostridium sp. CAG:571]HJJ13448.1 threonine--tRNA ligase [Clostridiaceae bacterium]
MIKIELKDGSIKEIESGKSIFEIAKSISEGLARVATAGKVNGEVKDLRTIINEDCRLEILTFDSCIDGKKAYWHTTSHIMAQAIKRLFPEVKLAIGPAIDEGFYYDFDTEKPFTDEDKEKIEQEMKKIIKEDLAIERFSLPKKEALELMKDEPYKQELINDLKDGEEISFYKQGEFTDLCAGPHLMSTGKVKSIKILNSSGAYWRGSEKNKMLQRIYAISFPKASLLEEHMHLLEEAKERDHRKIGKELKLFMTHKLVGSGLPMYLPKGATIRRTLERYIQDKEIALGYSHVYTPSLANVELYKTSGHWDHYKDDMFPAMKMDTEEMVLRPMNCPHHMLIYKNELHSYKELPIKIGELAHDFRYENSGAVCGLERVRQMCQNDAHLFVRPDQIKEEVGRVLNLIFEVYLKDFGFPRESFSFRLSLRDKNNKEKYIDNDAMWETAESQLRDILKELNIDFYEAEGEAAFYGPKIDIQIKTALNHDVTIPTCQLDFALPERFDLTYIGEDGKEHRPVVIHRAILGSSDRFISFLIEETKGAFPTWLAPVQVKLLPISDSQVEYCQKIKSELMKNKVRVELDDRNEKIGYKIREAQLEKVPYMLVIGDKEVEANTVSVRSRKEGDIGAIKVEEFISKIKYEIENYVK